MNQSKPLVFINWAVCDTAQLIKWVLFFLGGGGGGFWDVGLGVHRPPYLIFTLFQSNIYKVNIGGFLPRDFCRENGQPLTL